SQALIGRWGSGCIKGGRRSALWRPEVARRLVAHSLLARLKCLGSLVIFPLGFRQLALHVGLHFCLLLLNLGRGRSRRQLWLSSCRTSVFGGMGERRQCKQAGRNCNGG